MYARAFIDINREECNRLIKTLHSLSMVPAGWDYSEPYCCVLLLWATDQRGGNQLCFMVINNNTKVNYALFFFLNACKHLILHYM